MILPVRYLVRPYTTGLTDISMTLYDETDTVISNHVLVEIGTTGVYGLNVNIASNIYCWALITSVTAQLSDIIRLTPSTVTLNADLTYLTQAETGTWKRTGSILDYYDKNMVLIAQYELQTATGTPTSDPTAVANRVWVGP